MAENNLVVVQSNSLIEANYSANLTTLAHKVAKLIIGFVNPEKPQDKINFTIDINKLKYYLGWSKGVKWNRFYADLKDIAKRLNKEPIEITHDGEILVAFFLSSYKINIKEGKITFNISPELVPHLIQLKKNFTTYQLKYIPSLTSAYAIRIYELFYQYKKIGSRKFTVADFKKKVGAPPKYRYNDLKKRIILTSQKQLKENTNLAFTFNEIKAGRKISEIEFIIFNNTPKEENVTQLSFLEDITNVKEVVETSAFSEKLIKILNELGINEQNISKYIAKGFEIIEDEKKRVGAIERCKTLNNYYLEKLEFIKNSTSKDNPAGFLIKALKEDWVNSKTQKIQKNQELLAKRKKVKQQIFLLEKKLATLNKKYEEARKPILMKLVNDDDKFLEAFEEVKNNQGAIKLIDSRLSPLQNYQKEGFTKAQIDAEFEKNYPNLFAKSKAILAEIQEIEKEVEKLKKTI